ncbi:MAG: hypothetical protein H8E44_47025 [Planctomycetes bacterium]|nr:hypothetical protein [Planctomycetota bacterium]
MCVNTPALSKKADDTIGSLLYKLIRRNVVDPVGGTIRDQQRFQASTAGCENDVDQFDDGLALDARKMLLLRQSELGRRFFYHGATGGPVVQVAPHACSSSRIRPKLILPVTAGVHSL